MSGKKILLVDYDPRSLTHTREVLEGAGFSVSTCGDGLSALDQFKSSTPDLVLLSAMLPKMHGFEVCSNIRKLPGGEKTPVVIITDVYKGKRYRIDAINKYGATEYIEKPIEDTNLVTILSGLVKENGRDIQTAPPDLDSERTVQFSRDLLSQMVKEVPITGARPVSEKPKLKDDLSRKLEQSLAGLDLDQTRKPRPKPKPAEAPPVSVSVAALPEAPSAPPQEAPSAPSQEAAKTNVVEPPSGPVFTSEDLFTDIIASVERELQSEKVALLPILESPSPAVAVVPPPTEIVSKPEIKSEPPMVSVSSPSPVPSAPEIRSQPPPVQAKAPVSDIAKKAGFDTGLEKKLSTTLSGLKAAAAGRPASAAAKPVEIPKPPAVAKAPEPPRKPEPYKIPEQPRLEEPPKPQAPAAAPVAVPAPPPPEPRVEVKPAAQPVAEKEAPQEGINFGQYLFLSKIATGGMAELFKAKRKGVEGFEKILAIKRILPHMSDNEEFVTMFIDEAKLAAQLTHHNICQIFDLGSVEKAYYIAMEFVHGKDLRAVLKACRVKARTIPVDLAILITSKIASALDYAHRKRGSNGKPLNLVHRDVSPQNILISYEGEVKLVDFGIAKAATKVHVTQHGALKGKLLYMSPEQAWGRMVDKRSDLFSLGIVLYEMLTGRPLFFDDNDTEVTILEKVREAKVPPVREFNSRVSQDLEKIITKALKKNPDERYQVAFDLQKDLDNLFYTEGYNATSGSLAELVRNLFPEEWTQEGEVKETEKPAAVATPVAAPPTPVVRAAAPASAPPSPAPAKDSRKEARPKGSPKQQKAAAEEKSEPAPLKQREPELPPPPAPTPEPVIRPQEAPRVPSFREISSPSILAPPESRGFPKIVIVLAAVIAVGIIAFLLFRSKPEDKPAHATPQPQVQQPVTPSPEPQESATTGEEQVQNPPPAETIKTEDQRKKEEDQKRLEAQKVEDERKKAEDERKKEEARKKEELAKLLDDQKAQALKEAQAKEQAPAPVPEPAKTAEVQPPPVETPVQEPPKKEPAVAETPKPAAAEPSVKEGDLVELTPDVNKPELVKKVNPAYPAAAQKNRIEGTVILSLLISEGGQVADVKLLRAAGKFSGLNEAAMAAVRQWKFRPAVKEGKRVKVWITYPIVFKLN